MANPNQVIDETGKRHGLLTVIKRGPDKIQTDGKRLAQWWCECDCKAKCILALGKLLRSGKRASCGCLYRVAAGRRQSNGAKGYRPPSRKSGNAPDETGNTFDFLYVVKRGPDKIFPSGGRHAQWFCRCSCGKKRLILRTGNWLRTAKVFKSCGCQHSRNRRKGFFARTPTAEIVRQHKQNLAFFGKAELVGQYLGDSKKTEYRCLIHNEVHPAIPSNMGRGRGLPCCKKTIGWDGLAAILDGTFRAPTQECWLYLFRMANYRGLIKLGIASFIDIRPDEEYGALIHKWHFSNRVDAALVEQALKQSTQQHSECPSALRRWPGRTEIRRLGEKKLVRETQRLVDAFSQIGRWHFAAQHIAMSALHRDELDKQIAALDKSHDTSPPLPPRSKRQRREAASPRGVNPQEHFS